jgi:integrase/recombinase XerD
MLATLLYHALRREELCKLLVKDFKHERRGVAHLKISGKGGKTRYIPSHPTAGGLILEYLDEGHLAFLTLHMLRDAHTLMQDAHHLGCVLANPIYDDMRPYKVKPVRIRQFWALVSKLRILT